MTVIHLEEHHFDDFIVSNDIVIVDFWASWCGPCLAFAPIFEKLSEQHPEVIFAKVDLERSPKLAQDFKIRSIPHLMIFRREFAVFAQSGVLTFSQLNTILAEAKMLSLDDLRKNLPQ